MKRIVDLPLSSRNAYDLVQLVPGITNYSASTQIGDTVGTGFSANGIRTNFNSFYLDGAYDTEFFRGGGNIVPAPDALLQFRILNQQLRCGIWSLSWGGRERHYPLWGQPNAWACLRLCPQPHF